MKTSVLVLAAGMGSRFGGIKQIEPVGPAGEIILEYSIWDCIRAGVETAVFVIRRDIESEFTTHIIRRFEKFIDCKLVFQDLHDVPRPFQVPESRAKPWGTGHAVLAARHVLTTPFAVINADDFYGSDAFRVIGSRLAALDTRNRELCMVGYKLSSTASEYGTVSRGVCHLDGESWLKDVVEHTRISSRDGKFLSLLEEGREVELSGDTTVSMNLFGLEPGIFPAAEAYFAEFLELAIDDPKREFYIPFLVTQLLKNKGYSMKVLESSSQWFGITYKEDKETVIANLRALVQNGSYPSPLW